MISYGKTLVITMVVFVLTILCMGQMIKPMKQTMYQNHKMITECESTLNRDQFCEIVAIPKVKK